MDPYGGTGFHHVAIYAHDFDLSLAFYRGVLGFREKIGWGEAPERRAMLDVGNGAYLEVFEGGEAGPKPEGAIIHFALRTNELDAVYARALQAGASVRTAPKDLIIASTPPVPARIAFFIGPDGEVIELLQNRLV